MKGRTKKQGFSLIEMIVVISVFTLISGAIVSSILYFYESNRTVVQQSFAINSARKGVEFMVRDIREASFSDEGSYPIVSMATSSFYFYSDIDRDENIERIRYFLSDTNLEKGVTQATGSPPVYNDSDEIVNTVSDSVRNIEEGVALFTYFDDTGAEITNMASTTDVAFVRVNMVVNINPFHQPEEFTLRSSATLRNVKTNL